MQSTLCVIYNQIAHQHDGALGYFNNAGVFWLSVIKLQYKHKMAIEKRKYVAKKTAEKRKLFLRRKIISIGTASTKYFSRVLGE